MIFFRRYRLKELEKKTRQEPEVVEISANANNCVVDPNAVMFLIEEDGGACSPPRHHDPQV